MFHKYISASLSPSPPLFQKTDCHWSESFLCQHRISCSATPSSYLTEKHVCVCVYMHTHAHTRIHVCVCVYSASIIYALATLCESPLYAWFIILKEKQKRCGEGKGKPKGNLLLLLFIPTSLSSSTSSHTQISPKHTLWLHSASSEGFYWDWVCRLLGMMQGRQFLSHRQIAQSSAALPAFRQDAIYTQSLMWKYMKIWKQSSRHD